MLTNGSLAAGLSGTLFVDDSGRQARVAIAVTRFRIAARGVAFVPLCFCRLLCGRHRAQFLRYRFTLALFDSRP